MENQQPQTHFTPTERPQEQNHYCDQYLQPVDSSYPDIQNQSLPASSYQQFPVSTASLHRTPVHSQEAASINSEPSSYVPDGHILYTVRDGTMAGDTTTAFQHHGHLPTSSSVLQQEVPSTYSSVTGEKEAANQTGKSYTYFSLSHASAQEGQRHQQPMVHGHFTSGNQSKESSTNLADQPLDFAPRFSRDHNLQMHSSYGHHDSVAHARGIDPVAAAPSINNWAPPIAPAVAYPPIPPVLASGPQVAPPFGRLAGPGLSPTIPPGGSPFAHSAGNALHPTTAFSTDAYEVSNISERPKKASVPNWLREEIQKTALTAPSKEHPKEEKQLVDDDGPIKLFGKVGQTDSKSVDSSRSTEDEEDDEDYVEAARTAAINQEIKRVLTEVLLKVTDELFDEIATEVLNEDDPTTEVDPNIVISKHKVSSSPPLVSISKASAKVLIPVKAKESKAEGISEKSESGSPGDILGLANYASDDDNYDDEIHASAVPSSAKNAALQQSGFEMPLEDMQDATANGSSTLKLEEHGRNQTHLVSDPAKGNSIKSKANNGAATVWLRDDKVNRELGRIHPAKVVSEDGDSDSAGEKVQNRSVVSGLKDTGGIKSQLPERIANVEKTNHPQGKEIRTRSDKVDPHEKSSSRKDIFKESTSSESRADKKGDENQRKLDESHPIKEKAKDSNGTRERLKEHGIKHRDKTKESESRKRSTHVDVKEDRKETQRAHRSSVTEDSNRKKDTRDRGEDRSRHKSASKSDRKRRCSSSICSRGRSSKDTVNHANNSSDEGSDGSKRKPHPTKHDLSPYPVRSKRRQVSRSPHSKHSHRRHSPYFSLDTSRRWSRSRSPVRRQR
ncbi:Cyclin-related, putative isoform 3 [Quillaja saponaria]|uniref:Cyclin-related, putative isoform 3 n=1 Tax=Quillaja saponaria TaxID=32244 RepID=A0AAD7KPK8_QUISA|nr:Cyclin-related, putative isoform 3 [Quillaja saponaria]